MIEFRIEGKDGVLRTSGDNADILNELLSINLSIIKGLTKDKIGYDNLKDQYIMLLANDKVTDNYFYDSYSYIIEEEANG